MSFEGRWGLQTNGRVPAVCAVPAEVAQGVVACLVAGSEFEVAEFLDLEDCEEPFGWCVVPAVDLTAHVACDSGGLKCLAVVAAGTLAAAVGVVDEPRWPPPFNDGHAKRTAHRASGAVDLLRHGPTDDAERMLQKSGRKTALAKLLKSGMNKVRADGVYHGLDYKSYRGKGIYTIRLNEGDRASFRVLDEQLKMLEVVEVGTHAEIAE